MKSIFVHVYGYKSKELPEAVSSLINNQSGHHNIVVSVYDQVNIDREEKFPDVSYSHVYWDSLESPFTYLNNSLLECDKDYFMYIDGAIMFEKNWDLELVMGHGGRPCVLSGNALINFVPQYKFYPNYFKAALNTTTMTNWISQDFIFMTTEMFKDFPNLSRLKHYGLEEVYSMYACSKDVPIFAIASAWCRRLDSGISGVDYVPFSLKHNYDLVTSLFVKESNAFFDGLSCVDKLYSLTGFDFSKLSWLPFSHDDTSYNTAMDLDEMNETRFISNVRSIE
jgi:hypothetical protein